MKYFKFCFRFKPVKNKLLHLNNSSELGIKLSRDERFAFNTLPFVFIFLDTFSLMRCEQVCKLWRDLTQDWRLWNCIEFYKCEVSIPRMIEEYQCRNIQVLKIVDCEFRESNLEGKLYDFIRSIKYLRVIEISRCTPDFIEMLLNHNHYLEAIRACMIYSPNGAKLDLNFTFFLPRLNEIKLYCNRQLDNFYGLFNNLGYLRHVYLLGVKNLDLRLLHTLEIPKSCKLESLGLGNCEFLGNNFVTFLQALPLLKKLRLEGCDDWQALAVLEGISKCSQLESLELIDFNINKHFDAGLRLCTNLKELTVIPKANQFNMPDFNARLLKGVYGLKKTLRKLTWGFSERCMKYFCKKWKTTDSVPFLIGDENAREYDMIRLKDLEKRLRSSMETTQIVLTISSAPVVDVFSARY